MNTPSSFNICLIQPDGYIHSLAFLELAELIHYSLKELGHESVIKYNQVASDSRNIVIGCHLLDPKFIPQFPKSSIILNTEQIYSDTTDWNSNIFEWVKHFEVWDYSIRNIEKLHQLGIENPKHLKLGYQKELSRIQQSNSPDIDVLFYGSTNDRRSKILDALKVRGINVCAVFGVYGAERDRLIARSKVVLNHHFYKSEIFEVVRVFYLMANSVAVVGEVNASTSIDPIYLSGIKAAPYDGLVSACEELLLGNTFSREKLKLSAFDTIARFPQKYYTASVLG